MKKIILLLIICVFQQGFAQTICVANDEPDYFDENQIITNKCKIETSNNITTKSFKKRSLNRRKRNKQIKKNKNVYLNNAKKKIENVVALINKPKKIISFLEVEHTPLFISEYKGVKNSFNENMMIHIDENFKYPKQALIDKIEGRIFIRFVINENGEIKSIKTTSETINSDILKQEAIRIISLLPKFIPGKQGETKVNVSYSFHMDFSLR